MAGDADLGARAERHQPSDAVDPNVRAPWHLWAVGILALLFNAGAANDYLMLKAGNDTYRSALSEAQLLHYAAYPAWMTAAWATTVWLAVLGALLLLFRRKLATTAFLISAAAYCVALLYTYGMAQPRLGVLTQTGNVFAAIMGMHLVALWYYARRMQSRHVLR